MLRMRIRAVVTATLLMSLAGADQPPQDAQALRAKLAAPVNVQGFDEGTPFGDAIGFLQERYAFKAVNDQKALRAAGIEDIGKRPVKLPAVSQVSLHRVLELLLHEASTDRHSIRYRIHPGAIEITTALDDVAMRGRRFDLYADKDFGNRCVAELRAKLRMPVHLQGFDAGTPLKDTLGFLSERYGITILVDRAAFQRAGLAEPETTQIKLAELQSVPLAHVLQRLLVQVERSGGVTADFRLRPREVEIGPNATLPPRLVFSRDGKLLATAADAGRKDSLVRSWESGSGRFLQQFRVPNAELAGIAFALDHRNVAILARAGEECRWTLWNAVTGRTERSVHWAAGGYAALTADGLRTVSAAPNEWRIWDLPSGRERRRPALPGLLAGLTSTPDARTTVGLLQEAEASTAMVWRSGLAGEPMRLRLAAPRDGEPMPMLSVALSNDGQLLASVDCLGQLDLWEVVSGRMSRLESSALVHEAAFSPDGRLVAVITELDLNPTVEVWEVSGGKALGRFRGDGIGRLLSLAFAPDGKSLAACTEDGTPIVWDLSNLGSKPSRPVTSDQLDESWSWLASPQVPRARQAIDLLGAHPEQAVPFLRERLKPASLSREARQAVYERALRDLDSSEFARRVEAEDALLRLGKEIEPRLRQELGQRQPSLEVRRRLERIVERLQEQVASLELLRELRAIQALERAGTAEARQLLKALAAGAPRAMQTEAARAACERLATERADK